jgi:hypothetical protein
MTTLFIEYGSKYMRKPESEVIVRPSSDEAPPTPSPIAVWLINAFRSLPTDEDLRRTYYWESRRLCATTV